MRRLPIAILLLVGCHGLLDLPDDLGFESSAPSDAAASDSSPSPDSSSEPSSAADGNADKDAILDKGDVAIDPCTTGFCENFDGPSPLSAWMITKGGAATVGLTSKDARSAPNALLVTSDNPDAYIARNLTIPNAIGCDFDMRVDSFSGEARFFSLRNVEYGNPDYWEVEWGKKSGQLYMWQYAFVNATGASMETYPTAIAPPPGTWQHVRVDIVMQGTARVVTVDVTNGGELRAALPAPTTTQFVLRLGLMSVSTATQVYLDNIVCGIT